MQLKNAIDEYIRWAGLKVKKNTIAGYDLYLRQFCLFLRNPPIEYITEMEVVEYFNTMLTCGWSQNSLMPRSIALRNMFKFYAKRGFKVLNHELIVIIPREFRMPRVATLEEYHALLKAIPTVSEQPIDLRNRAIIMMLYDTGMRAGELLALNVSDLNFDYNEHGQGRALIRTEKAKGLRPIREVFWEADTSAVLKEWLLARDYMRLDLKVHFAEPDALFIGTRAWQAGKRLANSGLNIMMRKISRDAGIATVNPHSLRHLKGRDLNAMGANNSTISDFLGHTKMESSRIYTVMDNKELQKAAVRFRRPR